MLERLRYRRQFLLARRFLSELGDWQQFRLGEHTLHVHPDLQAKVVSGASLSLTLLGYLFDSSHPEFGNRDILECVLREAEDFDSCVKALKPYAGRYVLFYQTAGCLRLISDALALREVYYCRTPNQVICGSQPNLLAWLSSPKIRESGDPELSEFVRLHMPSVRNGRLWPGDGTPFEGVGHLLPNHYLDLTTMSSHRFWPSGPIERLDLHEAVVRSASFLKGAMKAAARRFPLMLAVTAGEDSRALLAASRDICHSVYFFINKHESLGEQSPDIRIPRMLFKRLGLPFHVHQIPHDVPTEYSRIFFENVYYARQALLPVIYNIYYGRHSDKVNVLGVGEVGRTKYFNEPRTLTPYYLSYMLKYRKSPYAVAQCDAWLAEAGPVARRWGLNTMTLFWWEVLIGNWGAVGNSESDIAIEEFDPYCSHLLYETFLSVDPKYRTFRDNALFRELIRFMWPELLELPMNPPYSPRDWIVSGLHKLGAEEGLRAGKARLHEIWHNAVVKRSAGRHIRDG